MPITVDFTQTSAENEPLDEGFYGATVSACKAKQSSAGNPMLEWRFTVETPDEFAGRSVFTNTVLTPGALWKLYAFLKGLGYTSEELAGELEFDPSDVIGLTCMIQVIQRAYQKQMRNDVAKVMPLEDTSDDTSDDTPEVPDEIPF